MEYTNDVVFDVEYNKEENTLKFGNKKWTIRIIKKVKDNKIITIIVSFCTCLIILDCFLISRFFELVKTLYMEGIK